MALRLKAHTAEAAMLLLWEEIRGVNSNMVYSNFKQEIRVRQATR